MPPSKKESGVRFNIPITLGELNSISLPLQLMLRFLEKNVSLEPILHTNIKGKVKHLN